MWRKAPRSLAAAPKPGTRAHFEAWASELTLDTGDPWTPEPWQLDIVEDILSGKHAVWIVIPQGNGKTTLMAAVALYHLDPEGWGIHRPFVAVAAATREQAEWLYQQAEGLVLDSDSMRGRFKCQSGFRRIRLPADDEEDPRGRIQIFAADDRTADGAIFTLAIIDELHNHRDLRLYRRWDGKLEKRNAQLVAITTAGEPGSDFEESRAKILKASGEKSTDPHIRAETEKIVLHDWAVRDREHVDEMDAVKAANPLSTITDESLRRLHDGETMTPEHWLRFTCNIASRIEGEGVRPEQWAACLEEGLEPDMTARFWGGVDLGFEVDCTAVVVVGWEDLERRPIVFCRVLKPPVDEGDIVEAMCEAQRDFSPEEWVYDPNAGGRQMAQLLDKGEHPRQGDLSFDFFEHPQSNVLMANAAARFDEALRMRRIKHDGNEELQRHVLNAVKKPLGGERWRFDRPPDAKGRRRMRYPIDALTALVMAHSRMVEEMDAPPVVPLVAVR